MADKENFSEFGIDIGLSASGFDSVLAKFKHLASEGEKIGKTTNEITEAMKRLKAAMEHALNVDTANKGRSLFSETDPAKRRILSQQIANNFERLKTLQSVAAKAENDVLNPDGKKTKIEELVGAVSKLGVAWTSAWASTKTIRMMYRWVDGIAQMNMQLRMLHYSSGLGIESLKSFGNAAALYGGSAATVSSYEEQYQMQISRAKRGLGLGDLEEAAWQYGFRFDANESAQERFGRAIREMSSRKIGREDWRAFAQLIAPGRVKELMSWANRGPEAYKKYLEYMEEVATYKTYGDRNLAKAVSKKSEELAEAQDKLAAQFGAVKDQFADVLIPVLQVFVDGATGVCRWFNRLDPVWKSVMMGLSALATAAFALASAWTAKKFLHRVGSAIGGGIASGMGGGFAGGAGEAAGGLAGGAVSGGGSLLTKMNPYTAALDLGVGIMGAWGSWIGYAETKNVFAILSNGIAPNISMIRRHVEKILYFGFRDLLGANLEPNYEEEESEGNGTTQTMAERVIGIWKSLDAIRATICDGGVSIESETIKLMADTFMNSVREKSGGASGDEQSFGKKEPRQINQHFHFTGDVRVDAEMAKEVMDNLDLTEVALS